MVNDEKVDEYLNAVLLASKSNNINRNKGFQELVDTLNLAVLDDYSKKLKLTNCYACI